MDLFIADQINKQFAAHKALTDVSIMVPEQSIFGLLGPNGAGKTTLIRIINQITAPDSGNLFFKGEKLSQKHISQVGYLPEERGLYKKMKVGEQSIYLAQLKGISRPEAIKKLRYWFEKFEIKDWWDKKIEELSKGMQQKIQFIVTILHEPKLLIFDEPFSGFDPINVNLLREEILKLRDNGATIIFSTHNMASVEELCDNIALINNSKKILDGNVKEIKKQYKTNTFQIQFSGLDSKLEAILNANYKILDYHNNQGIDSAKIQIQKGNSNDLLQELLPHLQVHAFEELIPSMNDIFIRRVEEANIIK